MDTKPAAGLGVAGIEQLFTVEIGTVVTVELRRDGAKRKIGFEPGEIL